MEVLAASVIAVLGTLLGAAATHRFQQRATRFTARVEREERVRQERLDVYAGYAGALMDYRRALMDHWSARRDGQRPEDLHALRREMFQRRTTAQELLFRVELLSDNDDLVTTGRRALTRVAALYEAGNRERLDACRESSRSAVYTFVSAAKGHLAAPGE